MQHRVSRYTSAVLLVVGLGCGDEPDEGDGRATVAEIRNACQEYCQKASLCDDETVVAECEADCDDRIGDCMADEQRQAVDDLRSCAQESCDDFTLCTIGVGAQCAFGL